MAAQSQPLVEAAPSLQLAHGSPSSTREHLVRVQSLLETLGDDPDGAVPAFFAEEAVYALPQTSEMVTVARNIAEVFSANHHRGLSLDDHWVVGNFALFSAHEPDAAGSGWVLGLVEFEGGSAQRLTEYWAPTLAAPDWRAEWVERI